jgi:hypothetical protein
MGIVSDSPDHTCGQQCQRISLESILSEFLFQEPKAGGLEITKTLEPSLVNMSVDTILERPVIASVVFFAAP